VGLMEYLKDKYFKEWLEKNEIIYKNKDNDYIKALYSEYIIEEDTKKRGV
jgi:hypothetical protein